MKINRKAVISAAAVLLLSGCAHDISKTVPTEESAVEVLATQETTTTSVTTTTTEKITVITTTESQTTTESETTTETAEVSVSDEDTTTAPSEGTYTIYSDEYKEYPLSADYKDFLSKCVFVGDSICSGLKAYDIIPADRVCAVGNVAARNIFEDWVEFKVNGSKLPLLSALVDLKPEYIVFSMGMNDVNMTSESTFCKNYDDILSQVSSFLPDAKLIVLSITPITYGENGKLFTTNDNIDSFNTALREYLDGTGKWIYADVAHEMKNTHNMLKDNYLGSPDGVHLAPDAYYAILYQLCERVVDGKVYNFDGTFSWTDDAIKPAQTTAKTKKTTEPETLPEHDGELSGVIELSDPD
ncbi:MAG: SGNH/GDSL hydrolase family protein [Ruminiclostridium sp.]|nr:SGNH/GDSL hydrolase family protein [Ruminiclostridium sp.]